MKDYRRQLVTDHRELTIKTLKDLEEQYFDALEKQMRVEKIMDKHVRYVLDLIDVFNTYGDTDPFKVIQDMQYDEEGDSVAELRRIISVVETPVNLGTKLSVAGGRLWCLHRLHDRLQREIQFCQTWRQKADERMKVLDRLSTTIAAVPLA